MASRRLDEVVRHLRQAVLPGGGAEPTDGELLECFVRRREGAALEALVRRHAPMVWGVCRRALPNHADAEDAFQATFLVLLRRAASVHPRERVPNWLHGVARRTALKARAVAARRRTRERQVPRMPEPAAVPREPPDDLPAVLDREVGRLPDKYRAAIVLCDLEDRTRAEAARQLGVPEGTVASRLARARELLARRLGRRGVVPPGGACVPAPVLTSTIQAVSRGTASPAAAALTEGVLKAMFLTKVKIATAAFLAVAALGMGVGGLLRQAPAAGQPQAAPAAPRPETKQGGKMEIAELVRGLSPADVRWDGQWVGIVAILRGERAKRLGAIGEPAIPELIQAMSDGEKFAPAHAILTMLASGGRPDDPVVCNNGIAVFLPADGPVSIDPAQRFELKRRWQKWYERSPRPKELPR
jgi:RNA polymerase sigma factor (sigma-70 family)